MLRYLTVFPTRVTQAWPLLTHSFKYFTRHDFSDFHVNLPLGTPIVNQNLDIPITSGKLLATYVWIDGTGENLREKTRTLDVDPGSVENYPHWHFDGSSTYQAEKGEDSDMILKPVSLFSDPFWGGQHKLVLCEVFDAHSNPSKTNHRHLCKQAMDKIQHTKPLFGLEQEYLFLNRDGYPLGWPEHGYPAPQGPYYCSVGADRAFGREIVNAHYRASLHAGLSLFGINAVLSLLYNVNQEERRGLEKRETG
ncbi:glutamine synthetase, beta-grasp domain protein [Dictyocaulus viviparus]|uniref:glutamine synthetase n=1 Tax=Dictyocaulus viviparus TaxID=29172 RepID=A0A0D8XVL7_DICVI|nr:glutamine synthetase, beta-grasp domain protein [Dictyocaulus viviparus]